MFKGLFAARSEGQFKARSPERDRATDLATIGKVAEAIESALSALQTEQAGLSRRVEEATLIASVAVGTDSDEYISREPSKTAALGGYELEMRRGRDRLQALEKHIADLKFLRAVFLTRFPKFDEK